MGPSQRAVSEAMEAIPMLAREFALVSARLPGLRYAHASHSKRDAFARVPSEEKWMDRLLRTDRRGNSCGKLQE